MDWEFRHEGVRGAERLRDLIDVRLRMSLGRHRSRISGVVVLLHGGRDPDGGIDKSCRIRARVAGVGDVLAMVVDSDWESAAERGCQRIGQSVAREIERVRRSPRPVPLDRARPGAARGTSPCLLPEA